MNERIDDEIRQVNFFRDAHQAEDARHRERMKAEEERWLFSQPEEVRQRWLEKEAAKEAAKQAQREQELELLIQEQQRQAKERAFIRLNAPLWQWHATTEYRKKEKQSERVHAVILCAVLFSLVGAAVGYSGFFPKIDAQGGLGVGVVVGLAIGFLVRQSPDEPVPEYFYYTSLDEWGNLTSNGIKPDQIRSGNEPYVHPSFSWHYSKSVTTVSNLTGKAENVPRLIASADLAAMDTITRASLTYESE